MKNTSVKKTATKKIKLIQRDAQWCIVSPKKEIKVVFDILSYPAMIRMYGRLKKIMKSFADKKTAKFPMGLVNHVYKELTDQGYEVEFLKCDVEKLPVSLFPKLEGITFEPYQRKALKATRLKNRGIVVASTGCITGDTIINYNRNALGKKATIEHLYKKFNNIYEFNGKKCFGRAWDNESKTYVRSFNGSNIGLHEIDGIVYSGKKEVYELQLWNGKKIKATKDHKIMTQVGWIPLIELNKKHKVMCDTLKPKKNPKNKKTKNRQTFVVNLWFHPYASRVNIKKKWPNDIGYTKRMEIHRVLFDAKNNNMSKEEFLGIVRTNENLAKHLKYVDPKVYHIHHLDHNHKNNDPKNLVKMEIKKHLRKHAKEDKTHTHFNQGVPVFSRVKSIKKIGIRDTFDIQCKDPYHNFVANGMVIHNSGKSIIISGLIKQFKTPVTLIIVPVKAVFNQFVKDIQKFFPDVNVGVIGNGQNTVGQITVGLFQSLNKLDLRNYNKHIEAVVVDEAHLINNSINNILKQLNNGFYRYGFTATPPRKNEEIEKWLNVTGAIGPVICEITDEECHARVTDVEVHTLVNMVTNPTGKKYQECYRNSILLSKTRCEKIIDQANKFFLSKNKTCLILLDEVKQANLLQKTAKEMGIKLAVVCGQNENERNEQLKALLESGKEKFICATKCWNLGFSVYNIHGIVLASARKSYSSVIQGIGRGRRRKEGKDKVVVIDVMDIVIGEKRFHSYFKQYGETRIGWYKEKGWWKGYIK